MLRGLVRLHVVGIANLVLAAVDTTGPYNTAPLISHNAFDTQGNFYRRYPWICRIFRPDLPLSIGGCRVGVGVGVRVRVRVTKQIYLLLHPPLVHDKSRTYIFTLAGTSVSWFALEGGGTTGAAAKFRSAVATAVSVTSERGFGGGVRGMEVGRGVKVAILYFVALSRIGGVRRGAGCIAVL